MGNRSRTHTPVNLENQASYGLPDQIGVHLSVEEANAWKQGNDAAHGNSMRPGTELELTAEAVFALACADLVAIDLGREPIGPGSMVSLSPRHRP